jgi:phosphinothricin acetyltransferase
MLIRPVDPDRDAAALAALYGPYVTDTVASLEEVPPTGDEMHDRITRIAASYPYLVAEIDGAPVGFAYASQHRERAAYRWAADTTVYLGRGHHRRGIGRALYEQLFSLLVDEGLHIAHAGITLPNEASVGLHESLGFKPIGVYRRVGYKMGAWRDVGWWQLELIPVANQPPAEPRRRSPVQNTTPALTNSERCR